MLFRRGLSNQFANGTLIHTLFDVNYYHRYHFSMSGTIKEIKHIEADDATGGILILEEKIENRSHNKGIMGAFGAVSVDKKSENR